MTDVAQVTGAPSLSGLLDLLRDAPDLTALRTLLETENEGTAVVPSGLAPFAVADAAASQEDLIVAVTPTTRAAEDVGELLDRLLPAGSTAILPAWETLPHERLSPRADTVARRLATLRRLAHPEEDAPGEDGPVRVLLCPVRSLLQPMAQGLGDLAPVRARPGDQAELDDLARALANAAYTRADMVEHRGEFAVRGGILDVFPPTEAHPVRVDFFGDEVDEIRYFSVADQRSLADAPDGLYAPPCREILLTPAVRERARGLMERLPGMSDMLGKLAEGVAVEGMESLTPVLVEGMQALTDLVPARSRFVLLDPERIRSRAEDLVATTQEFLAAAWQTASTGGVVPVGVEQASFLPLDTVRDECRARGLGWFGFAPFGLESADVVASAVAHPGYAGDMRSALADLRRRSHDGWTVVLTAAGAGTVRHLAEELSDADIPAHVAAELIDRPQEGTVALTTGPLRSGIVDETARIMIVAERDLTGKSRGASGDRRRIPSRRRAIVDPLQLRPGDYVVHDQHGVGRFVEMTQRTIGTGRNKTTREYLVIEFAPSKRGAPGDRLYVPSDRLDQVTKYVGGDEPTVNKMGGSDWARTKTKARRAVREIAAELVRLYSVRQNSTGHAFGPDTPWQHELEDSFEYIETPDQLSTIDEVKADMEKPLPMDRLISGDVGYGKTEIAVRAAFKAVQDGYQVAVLVPTTLLVQQHLETFTERYAGFPVTVKPLSRFQSDAESRETIDGLASGEVDIVIGTHRLLTGQVRFHKLGLVVIDEEQRFGVEHKETLKAMRADVDVLSMSATPIPRTLEMAVTGIREMSTLATPPEERHPVLTYVGPSEDKQIAAAIRRELLREGQVFYVHNRVGDIDRTAARLAQLVPDARIAIAHGKMNERQLERVILDFWEKRFDVLVCTTIIETGLDIANANTLIVENADKFGLSQLHQLRGRVGRGRERAYAYFLYPPDKPLTETANDRLTTLASHSELGAGMQVAMKDLEIRGAGNLLGGQQSGHIEGVGFDLYIRMVGEAVRDFRGEKDETPAEVRIELPLDAHLPHDYVPSERLRLEMYAKLSKAESDQAVDEVRAELTDRYGAPPEPVETLLGAAHLRVHLREVGLADVVAQGRMIKFAPVELADSTAMRVKRLYPGSQVRPATRAVLLPAPTTGRVGGTPLRDGDALAWARAAADTVSGNATGASA